METRAQNGNGSQPLLQSHHDSGRPYGGEPDPRDVLAQQVHVLSLDQIKAIRNTNEYTEPPTVAPRPGVKPLPRPQLQQKTERPPVLTEQQHPLTRAPHAPVHGSSRGPLSRSISTVSAGSRGSARTSTSSSSSEQRLLGPSLGSVVDGIIRAQPKPELKPSELKLPSKEDLQMHAYRCEDCGKCKCKECTYPRTLPSCWICDKQCLCSAQNVVDYGTCVCCVKGLFYHCSNDDEDNCADNPCSCSQSHCCTRWSTMGMVSLVLPCLWCYLPAKGCLKLCQGCYDQVNRPGCRCKHSNTVCCKVPSVPPRNLEKPT